MLPMIYGLRDHERYVYHYTKLSTARDYILKNRSLRLGSFANTNDPMESKDWTFNLSTRKGIDLGQYDFEKTSRWLSAALKSKTRLLCFSLDRPPLSGDHTKDIFSRGLAKPRMWAQYGDTHAGVCLVLDRAKLVEAVKATYQGVIHMCGPVQYNDQSFIRSLDPHEFMIDVDQLEALGPPGYVGAHLKAHYKTLFFSNLLDWRDELEWRIVVFAETDGDLFLPIEESLAGVIHGASTLRKDSESLFELTDSWNVEHMGLIWNNSAPWYDLGSASWSASDRAIQARLAKGGNR
ncbi:DUF2971 domain-containing protein [Variovorax paradoxus]|nr:DUF2971 domain-containing protein [Variovorax paradoxus]MBT2303417.1 DUF2971 domain-containing protein [Variovorax paradoxus]